MLTTLKSSFPAQIQISSPTKLQTSGSNASAYLSCPPGCLTDTSNSRSPNELLFFPAKFSSHVAISASGEIKFFLSVAQVKDLSSVPLFLSSQLPANWLSFKIYPESRLLIIFATTWGLTTVVLLEVRTVICPLT